MAAEISLLMPVRGKEAHLWPDGRPVGVPGIKTVLVVDDDRESAMLKKLRLGKYVPTVEIITGDNAAEQTIEYFGNLGDQPQPDLVILDFNMPKVDGLGLAGRLRSLGIGGMICCVTVTSLADNVVVDLQAQRYKVAFDKQGIPVASGLRFVEDPADTLRKLILKAVEYTRRGG